MQRVEILEACAHTSPERMQHHILCQLELKNITEVEEYIIKHGTWT